jgi:hypothetical protein
MQPTRRRIVRPTLILLVIAIGISSRSSTARAQSRPDDLELSYLWDGGAVPFLYGSLAARWALESEIAPPAEPRMFAASEGGATSRKSQELPGAVVTVGGALLGLTIALDHDESRWFHVKGMAEAMATTTLLTGIGKVSFGRHRPDYDAANPTVDGRRSFPSGHSSQAFAAATYVAIYLRGHAFDRWRAPGTLPWWEITTYAAIGGLAVAVPIERVYHHRHHATDALAGSVLGAATSAAFYVWHEHRYRHAAAGDHELNLTSPMIAPTFERPGVQAMWQF